jgi:DNA-binding PadR family transcriptional regulator
VRSLTDAELTILGLVAERPRHGYELEAVVEERGVREWTALGFSSIYYVLNKLEGRGLITSSRARESSTGRRTYRLTPSGHDALSRETRSALAEVRPVYHSVLVGLANSPALSTTETVDALKERRAALTERISAIESERAKQEPVPEFVGAIFDFGVRQLQTELDWTTETITTLEHTMQKSDIKKDRRDLYAPRTGEFQFVDVPEMPYLMVDGAGDPNTSDAYRNAVEALYAVSYSLKFASKKRFGKDYVVGPLEGLWSADDPDVFLTRAKDQWQWTMMITQPEWITSEMVDEAIAAVGQKKDLPALDQIRFERLAEGRCVQILHVGSYEDETPVLDRLHNEFMPANRLTFNGRHHEIYLGDPRRTEPSRLKTILRQPVADQAT